MLKSGWTGVGPTAGVLSPRQAESTRCQERSAFNTVDGFGFRASLYEVDDYLRIIRATVASRDRLIILHHNLHSLYLWFKHESVRDTYRHDLVMIDGMPVIWLLKLAGRSAQHRHRVAWIDFFWPLMEVAQERGWRVFHLGSPDEVLREGLRRVRDRYPRLAIAGHHGFFDATPGSADNARIVRVINEFAPDVCLVGMGMPRQERWIATHAELLTAPAVLTCGACMEFIAQVASTPPRWLGPLGLEWSYRLLANPRRFAHRYLVEPWILAGFLLRESLRRQN